MVEINDESRRTYNEDNQIRFKTLMLRLSDYSDVSVLVKVPITIAPATAAATINSNRKVIFKNFEPFTNCISRINDTQAGNSHDNDVVMPMYNLIEWGDNYSKATGVLWQYCRDDPTINAADGNTANFDADNATTDWFEIKENIAGQTGNDYIKNVEIMLPLKDLSNLWRSLEMSLNNCEVNLFQKNN